MKYRSGIKKGIFLTRYLFKFYLLLFIVYKYIVTFLGIIVYASLKKIEVLQENLRLGHSKESNSINYLEKKHVSLFQHFVKST